ncbi:hemK methyltransferase family member 2 [Agrilus planipennis]|uniref:Methyltransferase HEMK2 n=1 Tax=Agrilus planipennis TaxID=224129 RepID=A0A1W4X4C4_AGRPL|nr:hemK methyltransferase family member 2 [Agrilus planipennis]
MDLKTPLFDLSKFKNVYEPSEDTFLFLDTLEQELQLILSIKPDFVVEVGSGSGVVITALANACKNISFCLATDINSEANSATAFTAKLNNVTIESINMKYLSNFKPNIFDVVLFNPPYVVTESNEIKGTGLNRSWAGGKNGREVIDEFLKLLPNILSYKGVCYMVVIKENKLEDIHNVVVDLGLSCYIVKERKVPGEHLFVLKMYRK